MYTGDKAWVNLGEMTKEMDINRGVRQGCVLSPTLFNLFLSDFSTKLSLNPNITPVKLDETCFLPCLIWADDILLLSETKDGLQSQLNEFSNYSKDNLLPVNITKTKCMPFHKNGKLIRNGFSFENAALEEVSEMMYLGFLVRNNGSITVALKNLSERALKALYKIKNSMGSGFYRDMYVSFRIFDSIIKPILLYASDFWGLHKNVVEGKELFVKEVSTPRF